VPENGIASELQAQWIKVINSNEDRMADLLVCMAVLLYKTRSI
jgi:hypothetical protein